MRVFKYELKVGEPFTVLDLPADAKPLHADFVFGKVQLWVLLNPKAPTIERAFQVAGTGDTNVHPAATYINTLFMSGGALVWHVFEIGPAQQQARNS